VRRRRVPQWSMTMLTLPDREPYLLRLLRSLPEAGADERAEIVVVYNAPVCEPRATIARRLKAACPMLRVRVCFNDDMQTIAAGRNLQLATCQAPLICFLDDDLTLHGPIFETLDHTLRHHPVALLGLRSYQDDTSEPCKPRPDTPSAEVNGLRYMPVQGMLCAGYRQVLLDVGGFSPLRAFWGEWTELNTRLWRRGFPTGYQMNGGWLRHWRAAPHSPTRHRADRALHIIWGLACTALEYEAVEATPASGSFWTLVEQRYLRYASDGGMSPAEVLRAMLELAPRLIETWPTILAARMRAAGDPFPFKPFHPLGRDEVDQVRRHAARTLAPIRAAAFGAAAALLDRMEQFSLRRELRDALPASVCGDLSVNVRPARAV
jgi:hypothetical protein